MIINLLNDFHKDLKFEPNKSNQDFFEFGAGNIFTTIKVYYTSIETKKQSFIKLQFNFMEKLFYPIKIMKLKDIIYDMNLEDLEFIFSDEVNKYKNIYLKNYDLNEILLEKVRAVITRKSFKARDFIDIYKITNGNINKLEKQYTNIKIKKFDLSHDRFLIIDKEIYLIGASLKDLGKKLFAFSKIEDEKVKQNIFSILP